MSRFIDELMNEVISYGGLPVRRYDAYLDALKRLSSDPHSTPATARKWAEVQAFGSRAKALDGVEPISAAELEALP